MELKKKIFQDSQQICSQWFGKTFPYREKRVLCLRCIVVAQELTHNILDILVCVNTCGIVPHVVNLTCRQALSQRGTGSQVCVIALCVTANPLLHGVATSHLLTVKSGRGSEVTPALHRYLQTFVS